MSKNSIIKICSNISIYRKVVHVQCSKMKINPSQISEEGPYAKVLPLLQHQILLILLLRVKKRYQWPIMIKKHKKPSLKQLFIRLYWSYYKVLIKKHICLWYSKFNKNYLIWSLLRVYETLSNILGDLGNSNPMVGNLPIHDSMKDTTPRGKRTQSFRRNPFQNPPRYPTRKGYWLTVLIKILLFMLLVEELIKPFNMLLM